ncbi:MAG: catechol 2,3-dioxygenase-like lactoylglutathione lyase family enzyme [Arenicella sp.]|jgi:catechol 2,3-dioxygenase-like lactoylglutathione lyase family enzyme
MYSHIMFGANNIGESQKFYDAILTTLGYRPGRVDELGRVFWMDKKGIFSITKPINGEPASNANGSTISFSAESPEQVQAWHAAGIANGGNTCEDPPGVREGPTGSLYLAYLRDPSGNKVCALYRVA